MVQHEEQKTADVDVDLREVYFLILKFLSFGPCQKTFGQFWNELLEHELLARRHHAWFSRSGVHSGIENDDGVSLPLSFNNLVDRYPHIEKDHLVKLLKQLLLHLASPVRGKVGGHTPNAADVPTLLGFGSFSLLDSDKSSHKQSKLLPSHLRWPHMQADQVHGLGLREIGGGFVKHHRAPSIRSTCYTIAKPLTMVQKMQNIKKCRGHRDAVYCAIFDRSGRYVITGSDDRLVKIWSMETAFCLASCRGHEGDITDLAVSSNNALVASAANDFVIRVWRLPDGLPLSVLRGHTGAVTAIAFSPRPSAVYQLLSSSDDGTCRIWDARNSHCSPRIYVPKPSNNVAGKDNVPSSTGPSSSNGLQSNQILCCAYNANGTVFVTGSSDTLARVWSACKASTDESEQLIHEIDVLSGHENDVNYVQFSGCAAASRSSLPDTMKEDGVPKFKNTWFCHDNIVTCSRDGSAIIWAPRSRRSHGKSLRWTKLYHLKVPPPPLPPQPPRGGPRHRILPTPRGVNMIVWSLDNRFVLAAIMDCRICVWNAADSSLVHSLTGHTASSYVLDVHPFNPRIAMSAGYDGRTIVWDIWEGIPIRVYEIGLGRFKLVDGKFSPDGTSIVLSDDVGQIHLINTGQGESQKDAKYDQFFLGDYRPVIRDAAGNVLDQESQLPPHRRNLQDPLCDSSLIPYPEPYQTMFQQRRLGALGVEWRPPSMKFAVGPDFSLGLDYQMPPLEDLDRMIEPLPEFLDAIFWEPEIENISDDADSEYNLAEDGISEGEQGSVRYISPSDSDCSIEDSDIDHDQEEGLRRSSRRKHKTEVGSSGRHVKKRKLSEHDGLLSGSNRAKKQKSGRKAPKRKSSRVKPSRPQRVAARNAINMLSRITGSSSDGDDSEDDASSSGPDFEDSITERNLTNGYLQSEEDKYTKEETHAVDAENIAKSPDLPESQPNPGDRKKLVLKFSLRQLKKPASPDNIINVPRQTDNVTSCGQSLQESKYRGSCSSNGLGLELSENYNKGNTTGIGYPTEAENGIERFSGGENEGKIGWGEVKTRSSKHLRLGDVTPDYDAQQEGMSNIKEEEERIEVDPAGRIEHSVPSGSSSPLGDLKSKCGASAVTNHRAQGDRCEDLSGSDKCRKFSSAEESEFSGSNHRQELKGNPPPKLTRLKIKVGDFQTPSKLMCSGSQNGHEENKVDMMNKNASREEQTQLLRVAARDECASRSTCLYDVRDREKSRSYLEDSDHSEEENVADAVRRTRSMKMKATSREPNDVKYKKRVKLGRELAGTSHNYGNELPSEERMPNLRITVRSRSARSRQGDNDLRYMISRKPSPPARKLSWLILSEQEDGYRYIPQLGDDVVYLRQGHQEFIESRLDNVRDGPWASIEGLSAVEFCKVESLQYATYPGSGDSCCKIILRFTNPQSCGFGKTFKLTLPELINFPDFVVEQTWYDAAISRNWSVRDKCRVWWRNESGEDGSWWEGRVLSSEAKSTEFPDSPWERYTIRYKSDESDCHRHSPWELHDPDMPWEQPHINLVIRKKLLAAFEKLERSVRRNQEDHLGIEKLNEASYKLDFLNRFPVPLCPEIIRSRLEKEYYRSLEAVKHDIDVMMDNARSYFTKNVDLSVMERLSKWFTRKLTKLREYSP
ncbi:WD40/YVTN repeat-like-containing domain Bromodomain [Euphorbia peplus]|nr:WD40/YVTN repeat-like-containing domain Bromodomain [Euphorbia peplus]